MDFISQIASASTVSFVKALNKLHVKNKEIGQEAPIRYQNTDGEIICQKGAYRSTLVSYDLQPILNPGVSGTVFFCNTEHLEIEANLSFQISVWNLNPQAEYYDVLKEIRSRIKFKIKAGDVLNHGDLIFSEDLLGIGTFMPSAYYTKGEDFQFLVTKVLKDIEDFQESVRLGADKKSAQVTLKVQGKHITSGCNNQKVAGDGAKMCFVPNPKAKNLKTLKEVGGFIVFETSEGGHDETVKNIIEGKAVRIPHVFVSAGSEAIKGNQIAKQLWAGTKFCLTGEISMMPVRKIDIEGAEGETTYPTNEQVAEINQYIKAAARNITGVRYFRDEFKEILEQQYSGNPNVTFEGNFMFVSGRGIYGMHHTTTELSLTEENKSTGGKIYWEGIQALHNVNNLVGMLAYATGHKNREEMEIILNIVDEGRDTTNVSGTVWKNNHTITFPSESSISTILSAAPDDLYVYHSQGNLIHVSTKLARILGLSPNGGVNLVARCVIDIIRHYGVTDRNDEWYSSRDALLGIYTQCCFNTIVGENSDYSSRNTQLKNSTKTGKIVYTQKVRGIEAPWVKEGEVYIPSNDTWAKKLRGHNIILWRNPNPSYCTAVVKVVGPLTEQCPTEKDVDILLPTQMCAKSTLTVPAIEWYGPNNGDDDGDLCNFVSLNQLIKWAENPENEEAIRQVPKLYKAIYCNG